MKKIIILLLTLVLAFMSVSCGKSEEIVDNTESQLEIDAGVPIEPKVSQMKSICELAVMDCYYHNVAKFTEEDAEGFLWWKKDKHFWIEYSGIVTVGIDASMVDIEVNGLIVTITMPDAKILGCKVDSSSLTENSYIVDKDSADINADDEIFAFDEAQKQLKEAASNDTTLLAEAQQRAQSLLEDYIRNIGTAVGKEYIVNWKYVDSEGNPLSTPTTEAASEDEVSEVSEEENSSAQ